MLVARVDGNVVSTVQHPSFRGWRQLICQPLDEQGSEVGTPLLAADAQGAGLHQRVLLSSDGKHTRACVGDPHTPMRYMVIAVLDN